MMLQKPESHIRPAVFQAPKGINNVPLYPGMGQQHAFCVPKRECEQEQNEALSLVVTTKKKRHKVTDTRITPRTVRTNSFFTFSILIIPLISKIEDKK